MLVKGYKGMDANMKCRGMQYKVGKTYHAEGTVIMCVNGFHFCRRLTDVFEFYDNENGNRFFEVEADEVYKDKKKSVASEIRIIKELTEEEVNLAVYGNGTGYGYGYCNDYGDGNGDGTGYGYGYRNGNGYGCGYSYVYGNSYRNGNGYGNGTGYGYGYRNGNGSGGGCVYDNGDGNGDGTGDNTQNIMIFE